MSYRILLKACGIAVLTFVVSGHSSAAIVHRCDWGTSTLPGAPNPTLFQEIEIDVVSSLTMNRLVMVNVEIAQTVMPGTTVGGLPVTYPIRNMQPFAGQHVFFTPPFGAVWKLEALATAWGNIGIGGLRVPVIVWQNDCEDLGQVNPPS
jgi:hypothetical protein